MSRQNYYKTRKARNRREVKTGLVKELVKAERELQPRLGGLKLHHMLKDELAAAGAPLGRDRFMEVLREEGLLLEPLPKAPRTTWSRHSLPVFENLVKERDVSAPNEVWVADITYLRLADEFAYLSLITDLYSHQVVGYHVATSLEASETLKALEMALESRPEESQPTHHSDRGCQYCCHAYVKRLQGIGMAVSMTEENHCAENAVAERINGIMKQEYFLSSTFKNLEQARAAVEEAVFLYNHRRPHRSLNLKTPAEIHLAAA